MELPSGEPGGADVVTGIPRNEPTVAVNPHNPLNVIAAGLWELRFSTDGGLSFSNAIPAPVPPGFGPAGDPSIAFDSQGRLFWSYLGFGSSGLHVFVSQINPSTGAVVAGPVNVTASAGFPGGSHDKQWLAADRFVGSPFQDRLYVVWSDFSGPGGVTVRATYSTDQGMTWTPALTLSAPTEGFPWPTHNAVAANGDLYVSYHSQPSFSGGAPDGVSGQVFVLRSTDGGVSYPQKNTAYGPGFADLTFNVQFASSRVLPNNRSWMQGAAQAWVLPNPLNANEVFVVAGDDPTNTNHGAGFDDTAVYIVRSTDQGVNWSPPVQIDSGPGTTIQFFPTAAIDDVSGCIAVTWYDSRNGATNADGNFLLDVFTISSGDGGITFGPEVKLNDTPFDPDFGAADRFPPSRTLRIGEYNGVAVDGQVGHAVWTGNNTTGQQILYDNFRCVDMVVTVDIKPASDPNSIGLRSNGIIPVAILGSDTFDVTTIDFSTLAFGPSGAAPVDKVGRLEDVNLDGFDDLVSRYRSQETGIVSGDTAACIRGENRDGIKFSGCDAVRTLN